MIQHKAVNKETRTFLLPGVSESHLDGFLQHVTKYLDAVKQRDLKIFSGGLRADLFQKAILPSRELNSLQEYLDGQKFWFEGKDGQWDYVIENVLLGQNFGRVVMRADYQGVYHGEVVDRIILISDDFLSVEGAWYMTFSQNTVIKDR